MSYVVNLLKKPPNEILTPVSEFLLQQQLEDSQLYKDSDLLEVWTESLLSEVWLKIRKSSEREADWKYRSPLHRKMNILRTIEGDLKNPTPQQKEMNSRIRTKSDRR